MTDHDLSEWQRKGYLDHEREDDVPQRSAEIACSVCGLADSVWLEPAGDYLCLDCALERYHMADSQEIEETGLLRDSHPCPTCNGSGQYDDVSQCDECDGTGIDILYW